MEEKYNPKGSAENFPISELPENYREGIELSSEVTLWTRDKIDNPGILELQEKANELYKMIQGTNTFNTESNKDHHLTLLVSELKIAFKEAKKKNSEYLINEASRWRDLAQELSEENISRINETKERYMRAAENWRKKISSNPEATRQSQRFDEIIALIGEKNLSDREEIIQICETGKTILDPTMFDLLNRLRLNQLISHRMDFALKKFGSTDEALIDSHITKTRNFVFRHYPDFLRKLNDLSISISSEINPVDLAELENKIMSWVNGSQKNSRCSFSYNFISEKERQEKSKLYGGADHSDYIHIELLNSNLNGQNSFTAELSESLGVGTIAREQNFSKKFRLQEIIPEIQGLGNQFAVTGLDKVSDETVAFFKEYLHVDNDKRQCHLSLKDLSLEQAQNLLDKVFSLIGQNQQKIHSEKI